MLNHPSPLNRLAGLAILVGAALLLAMAPGTAHAGEATLVPAATWWKERGPIRRFMPAQEGSTAASIIAQLDTLKSNGYTTIHITAPYQSAGFTPWWGLRPKDYYGVNESLGTNLAGFRKLVTQSHARGMAIIAFINFGYADVDSAVWKKARTDTRDGVASKERSFFRWADTATASLGNPSNPFFVQGGTVYPMGGWVLDATAGKHYRSTWQKDGVKEPQYDWAGGTWPAEAERVARHWMDTGIDGIIVDAPQWYLNCTWSLLKTHVVDVVHSYGANKVAIAEGAGGLRDDYVEWITQGGFDVVDDQYFESDTKWNGSKTLQAILAQNPSGIEAGLVANHDRVIAAGGVLWNYPGYDPSAWTPARRLFSLAVILGTGHMLDIWPEYYTAFTAEQIAERDRLMRAASTYRGLAPAGTRVRIPTSNDDKYYAFLKTWRGQSVLAVYNFQQNTTEKIDLDLRSSGLAPRQKPVDCLTGLPGTPITKLDAYRVELGPLGYRLLSVAMAAGGSPGKGGAP